MASSNRLVVEVVGDTTKLTRSLNQAQQQLNRFAGRSQIGAKGSAAADKYIAGLHRISAGYDELDKKQSEVTRQTELVNSRFARVGGASIAAGIAVNVLGRNFQELGGEAGKFGRALNELSTGNLVGFVFAANNAKQAAADFGKGLVEQGDFAKANEKANLLAAAGLDNLAKSARAAADEIARVAEAQRQVIAFSAIQGTFGVTPLDPLLGKQPAGGTGRTGITAGQRNTFFDNKISRELDRVQDLVLSSQVARLQEIKKEIQARLSKTKDPTRRLTLEDEIVGIDREIKSVNEQIAAGLKKTGKTLKTAGKKISDTFKQQADDIKSALLDAFDTRTDKINNARALKDAKETLRLARQGGGAGSIETATRGLQDANRAILRQRIESSRVSVAEGPRGPVNAVMVGTQNFYVTTNDADAAAAAILKKMQTANRHGSPQGRGRAPGAWTGLH